MKKAYLTLLLGLSSLIGYSQISAPDTVCYGTPVTYSTTYPASSYTWSIGAVNTDPSSVSGNATIKMPHATASISMQYQNGTYYAFVTNRAGSLVKLDFGANPFGTPATVDLGDLGVLGDSTIGIDIVKDDNNIWHGFIVKGRQLIHVDFGTDLNTSTPSATAMNFNSSLNYPYFISVKKYNSEWVAFVLNRSGFNPLVRFDFGSSLSNTPTPTNVNVSGSLNVPVNMALHNEGAVWYALVTNLGSGGGPGGGDKLVRLNFGSNLKNNSPTDVNLANPNNQLSNPRAVSVVSTCNDLYALITNENNHRLTKISFSGNTMAGVASGTNLGTMGIPDNEINSLSPFWYQGQLNYIGSSFDSTIYVISNVFTLPTTNATLYNTNTYTKSMITGGVFDVMVQCNQGSLTGPRSFCKPIVVIGNIKVAIKQDVDTLVASGTLCENYVWKFNGVLIPGVNTQRYYPTLGTGVYTVTGSTAGCAATSNYQYFATGIENVLNNNNIIISPNPSAGVFNISMQGVTGNITIQCYNVMGSLVASKNIETINGNVNTSIDLSNMAKGLYQVKMQAADGSSVVKQVVLQ